MIARALAQEPAVLLLDEPTAFLDLPRRVEIVQLLRRLAGGRDRAVLLSTHDLDLALRCADRLWLLPPGGPLRTGAPEDLVLSGAFQRTFGGVEFNPATGSFHLEQEPEAEVGLQGEGVAAHMDGARPGASRLPRRGRGKFPARRRAPPRRKRHRLAAPDPVRPAPLHMPLRGGRPP